MVFKKFTPGKYKIRITSASTFESISAISGKNVLLQNIDYESDLVVTAVVASSDYAVIQNIIEKRGESVLIVEKIGLYWYLLALNRRKVLLAGIVVLLWLTAFLPTRILFVKVHGNITVPANMILEKVESYGVGFGAVRRNIRSESVKNGLLREIPQLKWACVNTIGCVATITVRERTFEVHEENNPATDVVAARDGIVTEVIVRNGTTAVKVGEGVQKGQVLISGYTDLGGIQKITKADGEVFGKTNRFVTSVMLTNMETRSVQKEQKKYYSIIFGKNLLKLYNSSGISDTGCVKIYEQHYLTLPGGFCLPVAIVIESLIRCEMGEILFAGDDSELLRKLSDSYLLRQLIAGEILDATYEQSTGSGIVKQYGKYSCVEMIGTLQNEEIITDDE